MGQAVVPPGPRGSFLIGSMREFSRNSLNFMTDQRRFGDVSSFMFGPFRVYVANSPEPIHEALVTRADKFHKSATIKRVLSLSKATIADGSC